ncbi:peptidase family M48 [Microcystis phage Mwe-Yong1]|nr:peptidase family M48 [Microcystis phage Mwe-Yong1]
MTDLGLPHRYCSLPPHWVESVQTLVRKDYPGAFIIVESLPFTTWPAGPSVMADIFGTAAYTVDLMKKRRGIDPQIYICLVSSLEFQAYAIRLSDHEYCIAIWVGATLRLQSAATHLLSSKAVAAAFGVDDDLEGDVRQHTVSEEDEFTGFDRLLRSPLPDPRLLTERRRLIVRDLKLAAFEWLVLHECGHIVHGHLGLGDNHAAQPMIAEVSSLPLNADAWLTVHALEMDADAFAAQESLRSWLHRKIDHPDPGFYLGLIVMGSTYLTMRSLEERRDESIDFFATDHPPPNVRTYMIGSLFETILLDGGSDVTPPRREMLVAAANLWVAMEHAIAALVGVRPRGGNLHVYRNASVPRYVQRLLGRWAAIRPTLMKHKIGRQDLPAAQADPL